MRREPRRAQLIRELPQHLREDVLYKARTASCAARSAIFGDDSLTSQRGEFDDVRSIQEVLRCFRLGRHGHIEISYVVLAVLFFSFSAIN